MKLFIKWTTFVLIVAATMALSACTHEPPEATDVEYNLILVYGDGRENKTTTYKPGDTITVEVPEREGYEFVGWCTDAKLNNFHDFSKGVSGDVTLYAKWDIDYKHLLSRVSSEAQLASVKVVTPATASIFSTSKQGSGVIYKNESNYWYALTNNHVVTLNNGKTGAPFVYDAFGNEYQATVIKSDAAYDLAVIRFYVPSGRELAVANVLDRIPNKDETVVTVSAPNGKFNTVELARVVWYNELDENSSSQELSDVNFKVLWLLGNADHGSSGGAVYDKDLNLVGVIYGVATAKENNESHVLAVPSVKILEFISDAE